MKVVVDQEKCISCGLCVSNYPNVFDWNDDGKAEAVSDELTSDEEREAAEGVECCPVEAIQKA